MWGEWKMWAREAERLAFDLRVVVGVVVRGVLGSLEVKVRGVRVYGREE